MRDLPIEYFSRAKLGNIAVSQQTWQYFFTKFGENELKKTTCYLIEALIDRVFSKKPFQKRKNGGRWLKKNPLRRVYA